MHKTIEVGNVSCDGSHFDCLCNGKHAGGSATFIANDLPGCGTIFGTFTSGPEDLYKKDTEIAVDGERGICTIRD